ncbi:MULTISPECIES: FUSC family protein [Streptacidiphilus]|uniref:FUSC family protein n=1 Tax=Streptacidiphilus cavernicola TaxID=3342716 RepID=A0ABV6V173_9ACTN|nr:FUSC family protein [Streptacidiphilus jeojiense]
MSSRAQQGLPIAEAVPRLVDFVQVGPNDGAHRVSIRLAVSALMPVLALAAAGRLEWSPYALLASTVAVYGRRRPPRTRLRVQAEVAAAQVLVIVGGAALALARPAPWLLVVCTAFVAAATAALADIRRWNPPGALFFLFGFAVCASLPGTDLADVAVALALSTASVVTVLLVTALDAPLKHASDTDTPIPGPLPGRIIAAQAVACLGAGLAAGLAAAALGIDRPYWAMVSAIIPIIGSTTSAQLSRAGHRFVGTLAGVIPAALLFQIHMSQLVLLLLVVALMGCTEAFVTRNYAGALVFLTPMTIAMALTTPGVPLSTLLVDRCLETAVGLMAAVVAIIATHRIRHPRTADATG